MTKMKKLIISAICGIFIITLFIFFQDNMKTAKDDCCRDWCEPKYTNAEPILFQNCYRNCINDEDVFSSVGCELTWGEIFFRN